MNETDKQVATILESLQDVTPEVAEQAVAYGQLWGGVGLVIFALLGVVATIVSVVAARQYYKDTYKYEDFASISLIAGLIGCVFLIVCLPFAETWSKATFAPDYYGAQCITSMLHSD